MQNCNEEMSQHSQPLKYNSMALALVDFAIL